MRKWVVQLQSDDSIHVIGSNKAPKDPNYKRVIQLSFDAETDEGSTFDILEVEVDGITTYQAVQDAGRKAALDSAKAADKAAADAERDALKADRDASKAVLKGKKKEDLTGLAEVKQAVEDILKYLGLG